MNATLTALRRTADGRYLSADEKHTLLAAAAQLPQRLAAADELERHEDAVIQKTLERVRRDYPRFEQLHDAAWAKGFRDVQLVVRAIAHAMIFDDLRSLDDRVLIWMRSVLAASNLTPGLLRSTYETLRDNFQQVLPAEAFALVGPYLQHTAEVLSDFPEPTTPAV